MRRRRAVYELEPDLLLVFKPRGHLEIEHAHDYNQRVRLIRGQLEIRYAARRSVLGERSRALTIPARRRYRRSQADGWASSHSTAGGLFVVIPGLPEFFLVQ